MKKLAVVLIDFYRRFISPLFPSSCRFYPSCSTYAREAFLRHGFFWGILLSIKRVARCNPFGKGGIDYVPETVGFGRRNDKK